jgi:rhodanese-related sulfurtransferase
MKRRCLQISVVLMLASLVGCAAAITRENLLQNMQERPAPLIVDVRSRGEYEQDHIAGAVHVPFYAIGSGLKQRGVSKKDTVVVYCEHGPRAALAGMTLYFSGYERIFSLEGHMQGWRAKGLPMEKGAK